MRAAKPSVPIARSGEEALACDRAHGPAFAGWGSPRRKRRALVDFRQRRAHRVVLIRLDERLDPGVVLVAGLDGDEVAIRVVLNGFRRDAVAWRQTRFERPVGVDDRGVEIVDRAANDAGVELLDDEGLRIGGYVLRGRQDSGLRVELDKALSLEHA